MRDCTKLEVWQKSHLMVLHVHQYLLPCLPAPKKFDLQRQVRKVAYSYSVPLNIVKGSGKATEKDLAKYLDNALSFFRELEYGCVLANDLTCISQVQHIEIRKTNEAKAMRIGLIKALRV